MRLKKFLVKKKEATGLFANLFFNRFMMFFFQGHFISWYNPCLFKITSKVIAYFIKLISIKMSVNIACKD